MSSKATRMAKNQPALKFPERMYSNFIGSYMIASYILNHKGNPSTMAKVYRKYEKNPSLLNPKDENWLRDLAEDFGVEYDLTGRIVLLSGHHNQVFLIADNDGNVYPIREDGLYPAHTYNEAMEDGTIYILEDLPCMEQ